ncbi:hypothetical protein PAXINDRAFT_169073 [Paxillus involutus ATCC 200175]|uniref:Uncharacterized protein n=1 Tax=Paxillus involutus ATCC 200175 TaxID=664439 RepID=A0A0C9U9I8_PAXIN|nr:hypothetical protein PAXINDRAFT_169073 [Paxillus involutus ATCC 200175]
MAPKRPRHSDSGLGTIEKDTLLVSLKELLSALGKGEDEYPRGKLLEMVQNLCNKFEGTTGNQPTTHVTLSSADKHIVDVLKINQSLLAITDAKRQEIRDLGCTDTPGCISMEVTKHLVRLVRGHTSSDTEAGIRILVNTVLLRLASAMSLRDVGVVIIPEHPFVGIDVCRGSGNFSLNGVVVVQTPTQFTSHFCHGTIKPSEPSATGRGARFNIIEVKVLDILSAIPQVAATAAACCQNQSLAAIRGCITTGEKWMFFVYEHRDNGGEIRLSDTFELESDLHGLALVLGLLQDWLGNANILAQDIFTFEKAPIPRG